MRFQAQTQTNQPAISSKPLNISHRMSMDWSLPLNAGIFYTKRQMTFLSTECHEYNSRKSNSHSIKGIVIIFDYIFCNSVHVCKTCFMSFLNAIIYTKSV